MAKESLINCEETMKSVSDISSMLIVSFNMQNMIVHIMQDINKLADNINNKKDV